MTEIRIGTRGSPLALVQANMVRDRLIAAHALAPERVIIRIYKTSGDRIQDRPLSTAGGKGLFTKEIEDALLAGEVDVAVHSMKDMPTALPDGLTLPCMLPREDVRDAFLSLKAASIDALPQGAVLGTSSLRRQAQILRRRPDIKTVMFRGNVETRLAKLEAGSVDATLLAMAGLKRLGLAHHVTAPVPTEIMLPAVAQGAVGIECRIDDTATARRLVPLNDEATLLCVTAERAFLGRLEGSCRTPIGGLAELKSGQLAFRGEILTPDGRQHHATSRSGPAAAAVAMAVDAAEELLGRAGSDFFAVLA